MKMTINKVSKVTTPTEVDVNIPSFYKGDFYLYKIIESAVILIASNISLVTANEGDGSSYRERVAEAIGFPECTEHEFNETMEKLLDRLDLDPQERIFKVMDIYKSDLLADSFKLLTEELLPTWTDKMNEHIYNINTVFEEEREEWCIVGDTLKNLQEIKDMMDERNCSYVRLIMEGKFKDEAVTNESDSTT